MQAPTGICWKGRLPGRGPARLGGGVIPRPAWLRTKLRPLPGAWLLSAAALAPRPLPSPLLRTCNNANVSIHDRIWIQKYISQQAFQHAWLLLLSEQSAGLPAQTAIGPG